MKLVLLRLSFLPTVVRLLSMRGPQSRFCRAVASMNDVVRRRDHPDVRGMVHGRPVRAAPLPRSTAGSATEILALQRSAGNAAVVQLLRRLSADRTSGELPASNSPENGLTVQRVVDTAPDATEAECTTAIAAGDWDHVVQLISGLPSSPTPEQIRDSSDRRLEEWQTSKLASLEPDQLRYLDDAVRRSGLSGSRLRTAIGAQLSAAGVGAEQAEPGEGYGTVRVLVSKVQHGDARAQRRTPFKYVFEFEFRPGPAACADEIGFIQTVRVVDSVTRDNVTSQGTARMTPNYVAIDRTGGMSQGWYGMKNDGKKTYDNVEVWVRKSSIWKRGSSRAWLHDGPSSDRGNRDYQFEASVVCRKGADEGKVYAVVLWGFTVDENLTVTVTPFRVFNKPSSDFTQAVAAWNAQAAGPVSARSAPDQSTLPTVS
ncbi:hypothetical protein ACQPZQ_21175 [Pseudonocardia sp. CA-142604]|uniref:hypothetical protein n=1 Tax=Pseudonocardia sp. CA-142604 TaxID=3240024 RepID=UPI003D92A275